MTRPAIPVARMTVSSPPSPAIRSGHGGDVMPAQRRAQQFQSLALAPRHGHLRRSEPPRDLGLSQFLEVPHADRGLQLLWEASDSSFQGNPILDSLERGIVCAQPTVLLLTFDLRIEGRGVVSATHLDCFDRSLEPDAAFSRHVIDSRRATELLRQSIPRAHEVIVQFPKPPRDADRPAPVAEVAPDLPDDRDRGIREKLHAAGRIEAIDRVEQSDRGDLDEVVDGLATIGELAGQIGCPWGMREHQLVAQRPILKLPVRREQLMNLLPV